MKYEVLKLLSQNAKYSPEDISTMLGITEAEVVDIISELEKDNVIRGYKAVIDWEKLDGAYVSAIVELNVVPKAGLGFEEVAEKIMKYREVEAVYLMSGGYDLNIIVKGKTLQDMIIAQEKIIALEEKNKELEKEITALEGEKQDLFRKLLGMNEENLSDSSAYDEDKTISGTKTHQKIISDSHPHYTNYRL